MQRIKTSKATIAEGKLLRIANFKLDLAIDPLEMKEEIINTVDKYYSTKEGEIRIHYTDACHEDGCFNIYLFHFSSGRCQLHCFGKMQGEDLHAVKDLGAYSAHAFERLKDSLQFVIMKSRMVLKRYYRDRDITSIADHLTAFMLKH